VSKKKVHASKWTAGELATLRLFSKAGFSSRAAARALGRTHATTRWKAMMEGISFRSINQVSNQKRLGRKRRKTGDMTVKL
jgi:hypothetical protein